MKRTGHERSDEELEKSAEIKALKNKVFYSMIPKGLTKNKMSIELRKKYDMLRTDKPYGHKNMIDWLNKLYSLREEIIDNELKKS